MKCNIINFLENNIGKYIYGLGLYKYLLDYIKRFNKLIKKDK